MVGPGVTLALSRCRPQSAGRVVSAGADFHRSYCWRGVSTNAAGAATFKYGATRAWVEALTVVLADGDVLDLRRGEVHAHVDGYFEIERPASIVRLPVPDYRMPRVPKVSAGYYAAPGMDLIDLFIGAEGTLGIVTSVTLRTASPRPSVALALVSCPTRHTGLRLAADLRAASGMGVAAIEHLDRNSLELLREDHVDAESQVTLPIDSELVLIVTLEVARGLDSSQAFEEIGRALDEATPNTPLVQFCRILSRADVLDEPRSRFRTTTRGRRSSLRCEKRSRPQ